MKITQAQLRQIIREELLREALNSDDVDWQRLQTIRTGDVRLLPPDQRSLAMTMISTRDTAGRKVGAARAAAPGAKIFQLIDTLRDSQNMENWKEMSREVLQSCDEFTYSTVGRLIDEINSNLQYVASEIDYNLPTPPIDEDSYEKKQERRQIWAGMRWPIMKDWAFRAAMVGPTVSAYNQKTGKELFANAGLLQTDIRDEVRLAHAAYEKKVAAAQESKSWWQR